MGAGLQFEAEWSVSTMALAYEQGPEVRVGVSHVALWGKAFPGEEVEEGDVGGASGTQGGWSRVSEG